MGLEGEKQNLLHYRLVSEIGQGGMSIVYLGRDERLKRDVAIKVLHPFLANKKDCRERLAREARIVARLQHPNIVQVYDYSGEDDETQPLFLVTEYVPGKTLRDFGEAHPLSETPEIGAMIIHQVAVALSHAHENGIVHRDLKPENVMVRNDGVLKVVDFGIAHVGNQESLTMTGTLLGSPAHIAPEIIEGKNPDERSDIFSLATVLYWLSTGTLPFHGKNPHSLLRAITEGRFEAPQQLNPRITDAFNQIIILGMQTKPEERFQSLYEMTEAIELALRQLNVSFSASFLQNILQDPQNNIPQFKESLRQSLLSHAETLLKKEQRALGLAVLSRVLADNPEDENAMALMSGKRPSSRLRRFTYAAVFGAVTASAVSILMIARMQTGEDVISSVEPARESRFEHAPMNDVGTDEIEENNSDNIEETGNAAEPKQNETEKKAVTGTLKAIPKTRTLAISVSPFADIFVDEKRVAENQSTATLSLPIGEHRISFHHQYAQSEERRIVISPDADPAPLHVELFRPKPAKLVIESDLDADVAINGVFRGTTAKTIQKPIEVSLPQKTHKALLEIIVTKEGYLPYVAKHQFVAGQNTNIRIHLAADSNARGNS